jgi:hypothetical protein
VIDAIGTDIVGPDDEAMLIKSMTLLLFSPGFPSAREVLFSCPL